MKFTLKNIGKINDAEIEMNGITLLAGENATGKSTIEKAISLSLASLYQLPDFVKTDRVSTVFQTLRAKGVVLDNIFKVISGAKRSHRLKDIQNLQIKYSAAICDNLPVDEDNLEHLLDEYADKHSSFYSIESNFKGEKSYIEWKSDTKAALMEDLSLTDDKIGEACINEYIRSFFKNQIIKFGSESSQSFIKTKKDGFENSIFFLRQSKNARDLCSDLKVQMPVMNPVNFIDSPTVFDNVSVHDNINDLRRYLSYLLTPGHNGGGFASKDVWNSLKKVNEITASMQDKNQRYADEFNSAVNDAVHGHLQITSSGRLQFVPERENRAVEMQNVSTGTKALSVLAYAIENGCITENSYLILDEPEINLHPAWQIKYAKILIQLQKKMHLNIMITTHSAYFVNAIEILTKREGISQLTKYYLTSVDDNNVRVNDVTTDLRPIYDLLAQPFRDLEEMENEANEQ